MGFLKSLKGKFHGDEQRDDLNSSNQYQSPEIDYGNNTTEREKRRMFGTSDGDNSGNSYRPQQSESYQAPAGPPPGHRSQYRDTNDDDFAPPPGPPPGLRDDSTKSSNIYNDMKSNDNNSNPPPYQDWLVVPDNSQLPPPPGLWSEFSPTNNASSSSADAGFDWCDRYGLYIPATPGQAIYDSVNKSGAIRLEAPANFRGKLKQEDHPRHSLSMGTGSVTPQPTAIYTIKSPFRGDDACILTSLPLYFAALDNPIHRDRSQSKKISFGVRIVELNDPNAVIGVGFSGKPYPPFRQPGWHRGSLAVHADDGHRYINDSGGGLEFVPPFRQGDVIVISMTFYPEVSPTTNQQQRQPNRQQLMSDLPKCRTRVDFQRNGLLEGGWNVHEERDADDDGVDGLQGEGDLYAAVGVCGSCQIEVLFWPGQ